MFCRSSSTKAEGVLTMTTKTKAPSSPTKKLSAYLALVTEHPLFSIRSEAQLNAAQKVMDRLLAKDKPEAGEEMYLDALSDLVWAYEDVVRIELNKMNDDLLLEVRDFGCGFDVPAARKKRFGLLGMTERVRLLGGECLIESEPDDGTRIFVRLPIPTSGRRRTRWVTGAIDGSILTTGCRPG